MSDRHKSSVLSEITVTKEKLLELPAIPSSYSSRVMNLIHMRCGSVVESVQSVRKKVCRAGTKFARSLMW